MDNLGQPSQFVSKAIKDGLAVGYKLTNQRSTVVQPDNSNCTPRVGSEEIALIEDITMLWNQNCLDLALVRYRGRAVPAAWRVIEHKSSSVSFEVYEHLLRRVSVVVNASKSGLWQTEGLRIQN